MRVYQLCRIFHCTPDQVGDMPSYDASWFIEIHNGFEAASGGS